MGWWARPSIHSVRLARSVRSVRSAVLGLLVCVAAGALCSLLKTPLPWMIGPLTAMAALRFAGADLRAPQGARPIGQLMISTALGLYFTPPVARQVIANYELFVLAALFAMVLAYIGAFWIATFSDTDRTTALFASVPGGAAEMANLGDRYGARTERIAIAQSLRVLLVVLIVPFALAAVNVHGSDAFEAIKAPVILPRLALLLGLGAAGGLVMQALRMPNAWMLGPLLVSIGLTASGFEWSSMPSALTNAAQVLLACSLGARFEREFMRRAPRFVAVVVSSIVVALVVSALFGAGLAYLAGVSIPTMIVATAPGGIAEMCLTARALQLGVPFVTAAHVARIILLVTLTAPTFRLLRWMRAKLR